ncbi:MAG: hypothetical protein OEY15_13650, partial [Myxococcales bacterium]|nr:hypothetical protein [Myxococcales bacterium]
DPCIPRAWPGFEMVYKHRSARYDIAVENPQGVSRGVASVTLDGEALGAARVPLADDGAVHKVRVVLGSEADQPVPRTNASSGAKSRASAARSAAR